MFRLRSSSGHVQSKMRLTLSPVIKLQQNLGSHWLCSWGCCKAQWICWGLLNLTPLRAFALCQPKELLPSTPGMWVSSGWSKLLRLGQLLKQCKLPKSSPFLSYRGNPTDKRTLLLSFLEIPKKPGDTITFWSLDVVSARKTHYKARRLFLGMEKKFWILI